MKCQLCLERFGDRKSLNTHVRRDHQMDSTEELNFVRSSTKLSIDEGTGTQRRLAEIEEFQFVPSVSPPESSSLLCLTTHVPAN